MTNDNWTNRKTGMVCRTCMFFVEKELVEWNGKNVMIGRCRRHAPTNTGFPVVFDSDWCGDHKLNEEAIR